MKTTPLRVAAGATLFLLALSGCATTNNGESISNLTVTITGDSCDVSANTAASGPINFSATNNGTDARAFEILASDKIRVAGEKENIAPGTTADYVVQLSPGTYYTACKKGTVGDPTNLATFTVTESENKATLPKGEKAAIKQAVNYYETYLKAQTDQLLLATKKFAKAYRDGDDSSARSLYAPTRMFYERIEPTVESFGDIDPKIDRREANLQLKQTWTGWHRIEKDLWPPTGFTPSDKAERAKLAATLVNDTLHLHAMVSNPDFSLTIDAISNSASELIAVATSSKITGEEDIFSHTDLWDFAANVEGAKVAYGIVHDIVTSKGDKGEKLASTLDSHFITMDKLLASYKKGDGYMLYTDLDKAQVKDLADAIDAASDPLSKLTAVVVK